LGGGVEMDFHLRETRVENFLNALVPVGKFAERPAHQPDDFLFRQRHHPGDNSPCYVIGGGAKGAQEHA
jgi:hypothetical protein